MPFDVAESINSATTWFLNMRVVRAVASSAIYTGLLLAVIIMLIVAFVFRDVDAPDGLHIMSARVGFWSFIAVTIMMHLHAKVFTKAAGMDQDKFALTKPISTEGTAIVPVVIKPFVAD
jgi:hypothetical protein